MKKSILILGTFLLLGSTMAYGQEKKESTPDPIAAQKLEKINSKIQAVQEKKEKQKEEANSEATKEGEKSEKLNQKENSESNQKKVVNEKAVEQVNVKNKKEKN